MNPIRHLLRKDWLAHRVLLLMLYGALVLGLLVDLGLVDHEPADPNQHSAVMMLLGPYALGIMTAIWAAVIAIRSVREDTPAISERFLSTRPVPPRDLWLSKALFLLLALVLPVLGKNILYLLLAGQELRTILLGTVQVALWVVPVLALLTAFAALWGTKIRFLVALGIVSAILFATTLALEMLLEVHVFRNDAFALPLTFIAATSLAALGFLLLTASRRFLRLPFRIKIVPTILFPLVGLVFLGFGPELAFVPGGGELPAGLAAAADLDPTTVAHRYSWGQGKDGEGIGLELIPDRPSGLPPSQDVVWRFSKVTMDGESTVYPELHPTTRAWRGDLTERLSPAVMYAAERHLDRKLEWVSRDFSQTQGLSSRTFEVAPDSSQLHHLSAELQGSLFGWEVSADVPLRAGQVVETGHERWTVTVTGSTNYYRFYAKLRYARPELCLSRRPEDHPARAARTARDFAAVLYDPAQNLAIFKRSYYSVLSQAEGSGYVRRSFMLGYSSGGAHNVPLSHDTGQLRLLILRPRYLGSISRRWNDPRGIRTADLNSNFGGGHADRERKLSAGQLTRWFDRQEKPEPTAPAATVESFLVSVLGKAAHCRDSLDPDDPIVLQLAPYVPQHLEFFLRARRALAMDDHHLRRTLRAVLIQGATPAQTGPLVEALRNDVRLAEVLAARGWAPAARATLLAQFRAGRRDSPILSTLASLGALEEELPVLLAELRREPTTRLYELLRCQATLDPALLDATVRDLWNNLPRAFSSRGSSVVDPGHLQVALRHGLPEAVAELQERTRFLLRTSRHDRHDSHRLIERSFLLKELSMRDRHDEELVVNWFLEHKPEEFRFDPIARRYALVSVTN